MLKYLIKHPTLPNLLMVLAMLVGYLSLNTLTRETFPEIKSYTMRVSVVYPGATAEEVESSICEPLEAATNGLENLKEKICIAQESAASMTLEMFERGDFQAFKDDIKQEVDAISNFPEDAEDPLITETGDNDTVVSLAVTGVSDRLQLHELTEQLEADLLRVPGVAEVSLSGFGTRQLIIEVAPEQLRSLGLSVSDLANAIKSQSLNLPIGSLETADQQVTLRYSDRRTSVTDLMDLIIIASPTGGEIRLGDIAHIYEGFDSDQNRLLFNGQEAGLLTIFKSKADDGPKLVESIQAFADAKQKQLPEGIELTLTQDWASIVMDRLGLIVKNGWQGLILVFLVLWLFFSMRYSFWVAMGLPISFFAGFFVMSWLGISLNMISLVALLIALGILVDDAIVLAESIATNIQEAKEKHGENLSHDQLYEAVYSGVKKVLRGVLSSFATTALIFSGTLAMTGVMGQILKVMPIVLLIVVSVSLIEAFWILPNHLAHSSGKIGAKRTGVKLWFDNHFAKLTHWVGKGADFAVAHPYGVVASALAALLMAVGLPLSGQVKFVGFPSAEGDIVVNRIHMPSGTPADRTEEIVMQNLAALYKIETEFPEAEGQQLIESVTVEFGTNADVGENGDHLATIAVVLLGAENRDTSVNDFMKAWRDASPVAADAVSINYKEPAFGPSGRPVHLRLSGYDLEQLSEASEAFQKALTEFAGVYNIQDDLNQGKRELNFSMKPGALSLGLTSSSISSQLRTAFVGQTVDEVQQNGRTTEVVVKYTEDARNSLADIDNLVLFNSSTGVVIPADQVVEIDNNVSWSTITRVNNRRVINVYADIDLSVTTSRDILAQVKNNLQPEILAKFSGVEVSYEGEDANIQEGQSSLAQGFLIALFGVYLLLSAQFRNYSEPLLVMSVIPLALIGSITGHWIMGKPFSMPSMMGYVALGGIVVNNSILLAEFVRYRMSQGMALKAAAAQASRDRFRAIFMTTLTTVAGMGPMLFETSMQAVTLVPLVTSMLFGLLSAGIMVLFVVPALYSILADIKGEQSNLFTE